MVCYKPQKSINLFLSLESGLLRSGCGQGRFLLRPLSWEYLSPSCDHMVIPLCVCLCPCLLLEGPQPSGIRVREPDLILSESPLYLNQPHFQIQSHSGALGVRISTIWGDTVKFITQAHVCAQSLSVVADSL